MADIKTGSVQTYIQTLILEEFGLANDAASNVETGGTPENMDPGKPYTPRKTRDAMEGIGNG